MMASIHESIYKMRFLDEMADQRTIIHQIHPLSKLLVALTYIFVVISFSKYEISQLLPFLFYPILLFALAEIPVTPMLKRLLVAAPFVIGIGIFNPIFDQNVVLLVGDLAITGGWISFLSLIIKCGLTVLAALLLLATTGMDRLALALRMVKVPKIFVLQLLLTYRYITVLIEEAGRIYHAYMLRAPGQKGIQLKVWGPLAGQLLLRTYERAMRVYQAMALRGFQGEYHPGGTKGLNHQDLIYMVSWILFFFLARLYDLPALIGAVITGVIK